MTSLSQPKSLKSSDADSDRHSKPYPPSQVASHRSDDRADDQDSEERYYGFMTSTAKRTFSKRERAFAIGLVSGLCRWANGQDM
ncbi:MAG: hypothetical protein P8J89_01610 [Phycisphaerales bacterium]|nr:hypothetical protein [Phycisphaerales bacterium]